MESLNYYLIHLLTYRSMDQENGHIQNIFCFHLNVLYIISNI